MESKETSRCAAAMLPWGACHWVVSSCASAAPAAEPAGNVAAAAEMAVAKVRVPAAAMVISRERLLFMNEGMERCRTKMNL